jgi:hypothetical protein
MSTPTTAAWQSALAAEQAAAFGYGTLGPRLNPGQHVLLARTCQQAHRARVDSTSAVLATLTSPATGPATAPAPSPSPAASSQPPDYQLPFPVTDDASAQRLAIVLEESTASAWRYLLATLADAQTEAGSTSARVTALAALTESAVQAVRWRRILSPTQASVAFPGI